MKDHEECVNHFVSQMMTRGHIFQDFEHGINEKSIKKPDLIKEDKSLLVEIKTLQPQKEEVTKVKKLNKEMLKKITVTYSKPDFHNRFIDHLDSARKKFRDHPFMQSLVVIYDLHDFLYRQDPQILMEGIMKIGVVVPNDHSRPSVVTFVDYDEKPFREKLNNEIGGIAFWNKSREGFDVFINRRSPKNTQPDVSIFDRDSDVVVSW